MRLKNVYIRFYKSFNFDYLRKNHPKAKPSPWDLLEDGRWYPYVRIPIEKEITAVVGANESGKSQLLSAIEKGANVKNIDRSKDFCRYSQFYTIDRDKLNYPSIGFEWTDLSESEKNTINEIVSYELNKDKSSKEDSESKKANKKTKGTEESSIEAEILLDTFKIFYTNIGDYTIYINTEDECIKLDEKSIDKYKNILPNIFRIDSDIALPESIPIRCLIEQDLKDKLSDLPTVDRRSRSSFFQGIFNLFDNDSEDLKIEDVEKIKSDLSSDLTLEKINLVKSLIFDVANIDLKSIEELSEALKEGNQEGVVNGITQTITDNLRKTLNFPRWWEQDREFNIKVDARDYDLVFTIIDRTQTNYSFDERSNGLKYFLSYYIQYRAYKPKNLNSTEILLMDEPDAYLSSQAQQDLLKIFEGFANPEDQQNPVQVIYVTHSPFLINKNHAERIRVLDKGAGDEGARVVKDASKNHYEPLRSAFGAFVGETTFIGNCNLFVEGLADQILIAGASNHIRRLEKISNLEILDLNKITIVPAGSASHIPYLVYLARGRDVEQPPIIVLLDSDASGNDAMKTLSRGKDNGNNKPLNKEFILEIRDLGSKKSIVPTHENLTEIEDLVPLSIYEQSIQLYLKEFCGVNQDKIESICSKKLKNSLDSERGTFNSLDNYVRSNSKEEYHLEKVGLARSVISVVKSIYDEHNSSGNTSYPEKLASFENNFKVLFGKLNSMQAKAEYSCSQAKVFERLKRVKNRFFQDKNIDSKIKRESVVRMLVEMENSLDDSFESNYISLAISELRETYKLNIDLHEFISDIERLQLDINKVIYAGKRESQTFTTEDLEPERAS
ncbi:AAA family ATPase [Acaryochloris marina]|uniref:AAA family ATPase n=1 Tax=Acaryochloris marina TaxID=155978 RepID=UPI001BB06EA5|nr:AAA family ATPase [Acaryochloris marina]QUY45528.1 AAA family ATPase [Acaryochloris marina S15]